MLHGAAAVERRRVGSEGRWAHTQQAAIGEPPRRYGYRGCVDHGGSAGRPVARGLPGMDGRVLRPRRRGQYSVALLRRRAPRRPPSRRRPVPLRGAACCAARPRAPVRCRRGRPREASSGGPGGATSTRSTICARLRSRLSATRSIAESQRTALRPARGSVREAVMALSRRAPSVVPRDERDHLDLVRLEPAELAVLHEIVRVPVMALVADVLAGVVEDAGEVEPLAGAVVEPVHRARRVEDLQRQARDLLGVVGGVVAAQRRVRRR